MTALIKFGGVVYLPSQYRSGAGRITGIVKSKGVPAPRKIGLFVQRTLDRIAVTWSDANGVFSFSGLLPDERYFVVALDHTSDTHGGIHDKTVAS